MASLEQVRQDIQTLSPDALELLAEFIQILKKTSSASSTEESPVPSTEGIREETKKAAEISVYERFEASGLIRCISEEEDLSTTYKQVLAKEWSEKYDHR